MNIILSDQAMDWFKEEMEAHSGDTIRFYARYGGSSPLHEGFSLGVTKEEPMEPSVKFTNQGILFYIEERDVWYFDGHDLHVDVDPKLQELAYSYHIK